MKTDLWDSLWLYLHRGKRAWDCTVPTLKNPAKPQGREGSGAGTEAGHSLLIQRTATSSVEIYEITPFTINSD